jgi:hypothetical protein
VAAALRQKPPPVSIGGGRQSCLLQHQYMGGLKVIAAISDFADSFNAAGFDLANVVRRGILFPPRKMAVQCRSRSRRRKNSTCKSKACQPNSGPLDTSAVNGSGIVVTTRRPDLNDRGRIHRFVPFSPTPLIFFR